LVHAGPRQVRTLLPYVDTACSGVILIAADQSELQRQRRQALLERVQSDWGYSGLLLTDPGAHSRHLATAAQPFLLPDDSSTRQDLDSALDAQRSAGAAVCLTPTGYIDAGNTDALRAAATAVAQLNRKDVIFTVPVDIAMIGAAFFTQTAAILADVPCPIALLLGRQFDPIDHAPKTVVRNLRQLAATLPHLAVFATDLNAFDIAAHGGFTAAIGCGSSYRHIIRPGEKATAFDPADASPSVLFPDLATWRSGSTIAKWFGTRRCRTCACPVCNGRALNTFLDRSDHNDARAHGVATWMPWARDLLSQPTIGARAHYWRTFCAGRVAEHTVLAAQLQRPDPLPGQEGITAWAELPEWPQPPTPRA
jgi:hypothetical protein